MERPIGTMRVAETISSAEKSSSFDARHRLARIVARPGFGTPPPDIASTRNGRHRFAFLPAVAALFLLNPGRISWTPPFPGSRQNR
jgi:hypothetical protein